MSNKKPERASAGGPLGGSPGMMKGGKPKNFKKSLKSLFRYLSKYKWNFLVVFVFAIGSTVFEIMGPNVLGDATNEIFNGIMGKIQGGTGIDFTAVSKILLTLLGLYGISAVLSYIQGFIMTGVGQKVTYQLRKDLSEKIKKLPMNYFDAKTHGEILSRFTNDVDTISQSLNQSLTEIITSICKIIGILIMMFSISVPMTIIALCSLPISMIAMIGIAGFSQKHFKRQQEDLGNLNSKVEEIYSGHNIVKVFNGEDAAIKVFEKDNKNLYDSGWKSQFLAGIMQPIMIVIGNISYVAVAIMGGYLVINGKIQVGDIQSFMQYIRRFTQPIAQVSQVSNLIQSTLAASERVFEFLYEDEEIPCAEDPVSSKGLRGNVEFKNVHFGYNPEKTIINDFSAKVKDSQKIAIVGPTGAGKTTMIKLLMRFYDVNSGQILIDGHDIRDFERSELRQMFGMVLQDTWLFNGTIMENLRYGRLDATDDEVISAAKAAHAHHFIMTQPDGYNMVLNEEASNVSQGQKQLLTIARAILADPKILILDEATSSVDTRTEVMIQKAMDTLMKGRTSFVIAHRLSTIRNADMILVMNNGDIVEQGNHQELIAQNGFYENLYNSQFQDSQAS